MASALQAKFAPKFCYIFNELAALFEHQTQRISTANSAAELSAVAAAGEQLILQPTSPGSTNPFVTCLKHRQLVNQLACDQHEDNYESMVEVVFEETCAQLDRELLEKDFSRQQKTLNKDAGLDAHTFAGSVGVVSYLLKVLFMDFLTDY